MRFPTRAIASLAAMAAVLTAAPASVAATPDRRVQDIVVDDPVPVIPCPDGSSVFAIFTLHRTVTTFSDQDGTPLREVRQIRFTGTLFSEDGSRSLPYSGRVHRSLDFATGIVTVTGRSLVAHVPGPDPATAGRYLYDPAADAFLLERGRTPTGSERQICELLNGS